MSFETYLLAQLKTHPAMAPQDVFKLCYQAARGAEHLLFDTAAAERYFFAEWERTSARKVPLFAMISPHVCRVDLGAWKARGWDPRWLFRMFVASASVAAEGDLLSEYLEAADRVVAHGNTSFSKTEWETALAAYRTDGMPAVHHSQGFREAYAPAYRLVRRSLIRLVPILEALAARAEQEGITVIAIDGRAASGKTTMARDLAVILGAATVHMDDFFLPPALRTEERLSEVGGNVHYERFCEEVIPRITKDEPFSCRVFDCGVMDFSGTRQVPNTPVRIVEGSYAHHPAFGEYAHVKVFSSVDKEEQMARIRLRNGEAMAERFRTEWIPREEAYFETFAIQPAANVTV